MRLKARNILNPETESGGLDGGCRMRASGPRPCFVRIRLSIVRSYEWLAARASSEESACPVGSVTFKPWSTADDGPRRPCLSHVFLALGDSMRVPDKSLWKATASSGDPSLAIDDLYATCWIAEPLARPWLEIDLGASATLGGLEV